MAKVVFFSAIFLCHYFNRTYIIAFPHLAKPQCQIPFVCVTHPPLLIYSSGLFYLYDFG